MSKLKVIDPAPADSAEGHAADSEALTRLRAELAEKRGPRYWRSLEELAGTPAFTELLQREFPRFAAEWTPDLDRRRFLQVSGASLALAGLTACTKQPPEAIVPYVRQPEEIVPGKPLYFATSVQRAGYAMPVLAESHLGRPTKLEGNPEHPASLGATDLFTQASVLDLYDPARLQAVTHLGKIRTWGAFTAAIGNKMNALRALGGDGLRILTGTVTSPALGGQLGRLLEELPQARWHQYESANRDHSLAASRACFGSALEARYDLSKADVVVTVDADLLTLGPGAVRYAKDFTGRRRVDDPSATVTRLYSVETTPTATGATADHRLALAPHGVAQLVLALAARLGVAGASAPPALDDQAWVDALADDLEAHRGRSLVVAGEDADPEIHTLVHGINAVLGNLGSTVLLGAPAAVEPTAQVESLAELVADMAAGRVDTLIVFGTNPVYEAPADLDVAAAMDKVPLRIWLGSGVVDETGERCHWQLPETHALEQWGDARAFDGTVTLQQPIIVPLYGGKSQMELLAILLGESTVPPDELLRAAHEELDDAVWRQALHDGFVAGTGIAPGPAPAPDPAALGRAASAVAARPSPQGLELVFRLDPTVYDGRYADNAWLQECPKPLTKLTWDNALLMSPRTARELGFGDLVEENDQDRRSPLARLAVGDRVLEEVAVWAVPGHADGAATLHLGYGRTVSGPVGLGAGFAANAVRTSATPWRVSDGVEATPTGGSYLLATTQSHHSMEGRDLIRVGDLAHYRADPHLFDHHAHIDTSLTLMDAPDEYLGHAWAMSIDLGACTGCNACVVACQAENNIPSVGKDQVAKGREMHWIRIDRYFAGEADDVQQILHQPIPCMQCEQAPCEVVCPVAATVHSDEGLNDMIYNRCVGTRYCSNNCPYKVRRFNFLLYADFETPSRQLGRNPDVTVRSRGVMEKCTYCVQRINQVRIESKRERRPIRDGEILTACQQVCPSDAIVFGDLRDAGSAVNAAKAAPRDYSLLEELGTRPRTTYLARIRNPNPALEPPVPVEHGDGGHGHDETESHG